MRFAFLRGQYPNPANLNLIKDRLIDRNSDVSRLIERLRLSEFVERVTCPNDRRSVDVKITEKGLMILAEIDKANETLFTSELMPLSQKEVVEFNTLLNKILSAYEQQLKIA
jgi:MarR family multiple gene transcriptional regulator MgrA